MKALSTTSRLIALASLSCFSAAEVVVELDVSATSDTIDSDWTAAYYGSPPLLLGNDGGTSTGGFHAFELGGESPLPVVKSVANGRTPILATVHDVADADWVLTIAAPDSILRAFRLPELVEDEGAQFKALGDWSALCAWRSGTGNQYVYLFGKAGAVQFLVRSGKESLELVEVTKHLFLTTTVYFWKNVLY